MFIFHFLSKIIIITFNLNVFFYSLHSSILTLKLLKKTKDSHGNPLIKNHLKS